MGRIIGHLDMNAFFAAVEERDNPQFRGLPIVVGADPKNGRGRGVVSTANYRAREYGIHSAMPISQAWRLSEAARRQGKPSAVFLPGNFSRYAEVSGRIMAIIRKYVSVVEEASIDEAYFDLSFSGSFERAREMCQQMKDDIQAEEGLTCSIGIGPNKLIAKIASGFKKPNGLTMVEEQGVEAFLAPLPIRIVPGIGPKTEAVLMAKEVKVVGDLKRFSQGELRELFGKWGLDLYEKARGVDDSPVTEAYEIKSIGEQETFEKDTLDSQFIFGRLEAMCKNVIARLKKEGFKTFRTVVIMVRFADFETKTRAHTLPEPQSTLGLLKTEAMRLTLPFLDKRENPKNKLIRLVGVRVEKLC